MSTPNPVEVDVNVEGQILHTTVPHYLAYVGRKIEWAISDEEGMDVIEVPIVKVYPCTTER